MNSLHRLLGASFCLLLSAHRAGAQKEIALSSGRPTFDDESALYSPISGKIVLEEHVSTSLFLAAFTTPFANNTNEIPYGAAVYQADVQSRLNVTSIAERVQQMDAANISVSVVSLVPVGIQGVFNKTLAIDLAAKVNDELYTNYKKSAYADRFEFFCNVALQDPAAAASELTRCVKELGGVGAMVAGYTNNGSVNEIIYLDDPMYTPFWEAVVALDVPLYIHPRMPAPDQQRAYRGYEFLSGSAYGYAAETGIHALRLMVSGLFDTYPTLQIILGHCGETLPFLLPRIDHRMRHFTRSQWPAKQTMLYYWQNNFFVTTAGVMDEGTLAETVRISGRDRVMFSVDYPFEDDVEISTWFDQLQFNTGIKQAIAYGTAKKLLKI